MVLPPPAAADREGPGDADWLERITRVLHRTAKGVVLLCDRASPGRLRELVVALCKAGLLPEVVAEPTELVDLPVGSVVVLAAEARHAAWLNLNRPVLSERTLRLILFSRDEATAALRGDAPDLFDWISHRVESPPLPAAQHAVLGLRAALRARAAGVEWRGTDLTATFAAALPGRPLLQKSASLTEDEMTRVLRAAQRAWIAWTDVDSFAALRRLRRAQDATRRRTRLILVHPQMVVPDFWPVHDRFAVLGEACAALYGAGATSPGRLVALTGMEPEAIDLLAERMRAGSAQQDLERGLVEQQDPGAWLAEGAAHSFAPRPPEWRAGQRPAHTHVNTDPLAAEHWPPTAGVSMTSGDPDMCADRLREAERYFEQALRVYRAADDRLGEARASMTLGDVYLRTDRLKDAEGRHHAALRLYRALDDQLGEAHAWTALGDVYLRTDRLKDAEHAYAQALSLSRGNHDRRGEANALTGSGNLALAEGKAASAFAQYLDAHALYAEIPDAPGAGAAHGYLARASLAAGKPARAAVLGGRAVQMLRAIEDRFGQTLALVDIARAFTELGRTEAANAALLIASAHAAAIEHPLAQQMAAAAGKAGPLAAEELEQAETIVAAALTMLEEDLRATAEDPYAPLAAR